MIAFISSQAGFLVLLSVFAVGAIGSLVFRNHDTWANVWSSFFALFGSLVGIIFSLLMLIQGREMSFSLFQTSFVFLQFSLRIDMLSAFFIFAISLVGFFCSLYGFGYVKHYYGKYSIGVLGFLYHILLGSLLLVVTTSNALFFLIAWETMSIASYFLVVYDRRDASNVKAGFLYLIMTYVGTAFIIAFFLMAYKYTGSFQFDVIKLHHALIPQMIQNAMFACALIGFGTKAGIIPFHIWLPAAHPAAPSHVSAMMSGVMIKTGIYMMIRLFLDVLAPVPLWWGEVVLVIGMVSSILGVLYALTEHDIKRLLAYHSIENIGIILLGIGSSITFYALDMKSLALLGLIAGLFHTINHALFKSLLFLGAGSVIDQMHTKNMEEYGGLIRYMPQTALFFLIGSMAISALPPFNGFFSEWLTFQSLFQGIATLSFSLQFIFVLAAGSLAFTGGLALTCFVKAFAGIFLARPRSKEVMHVKESVLSMRLAMGGLAFLSILFGLFAGFVTETIAFVGQRLDIFHNVKVFVSVSSMQTLQLTDGFALVSAPAIFSFLAIILFGVFLLVRFGINSTQKISFGDTWDCGTHLDTRMEITTTGFARSIILVFKNVLKPSIQQTVKYHDAKSRYIPKSRTVTMSVGNIYLTHFYQPLQKMIDEASLRSKTIQGGNINMYISYIFLALILSLFVVL
ncbi:MAG: proton-conducting transporter membrane subunit [Candidatus Moranbacteria bacterium]|nr:proton-conducting transporter membrane subunit [Candidatus Moranbacteria bacterium]MDD3965225.1 proton-conducting transporter membrane subunit [Candidatus Moranbacteria bacterium]